MQAELAGTLHPGGRLQLEAWIDCVLSGVSLAPGAAAGASGAGLCRKQLLDAGLSSDATHRLHRTLFVHSVGFADALRVRPPWRCGKSQSRACIQRFTHSMNMHVPRAMPYAQELLAPLGAELRGNLLPRLWRAFLALAEHAIKAWQGHCFGCTLNVLCVLQLHDDVPGNHRMHVRIVNCSCHGLCSCCVSCSHLSRATTWHSSMLLVAQQQTYCAASRRWQM